MLALGTAFSIWTPLRYPFVAEKWFGNRLVSAFVIPPLLPRVCAAMLERALWNGYE